LSGIATIKSMGAEKQVYDNWLGRYAIALAVDRARNRLSSTVDNVTATMRLVGPLALLWLGMARMFDSGMSLGDAMGLQMLALAAVTPLGSLVASAQALQSVASNLQRLQDVFAAKPEIADASGLESPQLRGRVEVRGLGFRHDGIGPPVLQDVSFTVQPGRTVAVVGPSGSGKSTLAMLLAGLYQPTQGEIRFDGVPLRRIAPDALRRQLGVVFQESYLFRDSIRRNIALARPDLTIEEVRRVAGLAAIDRDIEAMPLRYDTGVAERGQALSGGQRQRLSIARALAGEPVILLLDEATSHLDVATERRVSAAIAELRCTQIIIAHRLSTVRHADEILVLDRGRIVERGDHDALLALGGAYAEMVRAQWEGVTGEREVAV
jgi:ABC-type bacteriocin/lantibiotic exporter with double-glycine peptidase domain